MQFNVSGARDGSDRTSQAWIDAENKIPQYGISLSSSDKAGNRDTPGVGNISPVTGSVKLCSVSS